MHVVKVSLSESHISQLNGWCQCYLLSAYALCKLRIGTRLQETPGSSSWSMSIFCTKAGSCADKHNGKAAQSFWFSKLNSSHLVCVATEFV